MLTADVKRRIDTARDILVGKVPDPKSQVEQITIALIYKFMDDMDAQAEEFGGKRSFFAAEFAKYGWSKLLRSGLGGHEMLNLYAEAIAKMPENPGIPKLFREIFKNAFLPYRDPETLREFLKTIDSFTYDHSEDLGDAYEYLLSVLGSQGDAGQFRTPRHIIDFMVAIIDPKKDESILDPACGTAGFLISAYKHIVAANTDASGVCSLTPDEKKRLAANLMGYDISPDMVRLSQVNLYLHGFVDPHIFEYDTLTSQEKWDEYANTVFANPPFMSPKGGIKPHNRFSVQSKRSEVLFVDYIAEHLTPTGRSAVIVPEGIIFQSQKAYKQLRKLLVEEYLVAVVSLPAGLFQPYSGVKTSILVMDKALARQRDTVAFFTVNNDGFSLGAQRRPIVQNDLPAVRVELTRYLNELRMGKGVAEATYAFGHVVRKGKIAAGGEYSLSGERYRGTSLNSSVFSLVKIKDVCSVNPENAEPLRIFSGSDFDYIDISCVENFSGRYLGSNTIPFSEAPSRARRVVRKNDVLVSTVRPNLKAFAIIRNPPERAICSTGFAVLRSREDILPQYLFFIVRHENTVRQMTNNMEKGAYPSINQSDVENLEIPLPPLEIQKEIVAEIDGYQKIIDGARAVVENYKPQLAIASNWKISSISQFCEISQYGLSMPLNTKNIGYKIFRMNELVDSFCIDNGHMKCVDIDKESFNRYKLEYGDILFNRTNSIEHVGRTGIYTLDGEYCFASYLIRLRVINDIANPFFINISMNTDSFQNGIKQFASRAIGQANINAKSLLAYKIPLPPLEIQHQIVAEIEAEQALVNANKELITRFEKKIEAVLARVWGEAEEGVATDDLGDFESPDAELQFPMPGREDWALDCIPCAVRQTPHRRFGDYYDAAALGTIPNLCTDLLPPKRAAEFQTLIQETHAFANCEPDQRIRKELVQDALSERGLHIAPEGCSLPAEIILEREEILAPIVPYLFEALEILRDVVSKASNSQRIKHLTPQKQQRIIETWNQGTALAA